MPKKGKRSIQLFGELAALLGLASERPRSDGTRAQVTMVAGARFIQARTSTELRKFV